jgi:CBS domain containing-hemolysin-like protein
MVVVVTVLKPVVVSLNAIANGVLRLLRVTPRDEVSSTFTHDQVAALVDESRHEGLLREDEYDRLAGALGFTERTVESVLLRLDELATLRRGATVIEVEELCATTGYSRFPVGDDAGDLVGYVHIKDVVEVEVRADEPLEDKWLRPFATLRPHDRLHEALTQLRRRGVHMGRVVEDDGRLLGLITLEDVLEELVGEIRDAAHLER